MNGIIWFLKLNIKLNDLIFLKKTDLPIDFIRTYKDQLTWSLLSKTYPFKENELEEFKNYLDMDQLLDWNKVPEHFLNAHIKKFNKTQLECIARRQKVSEQFIEKYKKILDWNFIIVYQDLSENFLIKKAKELNLEFKYEFFINKRYLKFSKNFYKKCAKYINWHSLSYVLFSHEEVDFDWLDKMDIAKYLNWNAFFEYSHTNFSMIKKYIAYFDHQTKTSFIFNRIK